jgi:probable O-glycosylation ligase (exosortase A-associated)
VRDLIITAVIFGSLPFIFWRPQIGVLMWVWISVMNPHRLAWGFAYNMNFVEIVALVTIASAILSKDIRRPPLCLITIAQAGFVVWVGVTTVYALHPPQAVELWMTLMKTQILAFLIPMLFHRKEDLRKLLWVIVLSIGFFGAKGGAWILMTGGGNRVWGPLQSYIADNNAIAAAIVMTIPLMRYLQVTTPHRAVRWALMLTMLLCGIAVLGTYSRGAFLAVWAMLLFLWWKSRQKLAFLVMAAIVIPFALSVMPEQWYSRMETIKEYQLDSSANMRLNSWATMLNLAKDRPLVGGGLEVATPEVYARYSPDFRFPPQVAHSIYFQALGEHGFVGLGLYLLFLYAIWRTASSIIRSTSGRADMAWARELALMMHVCLVGFGVGGAFLSLVNFDVPYYLAGLMAAVLTLVKRQIAPSPAQPGNQQVIGFSADASHQSETALKVRPQP